MPKKAKKGGGGKGGGRTEEERLVYLQQRAQAEEEMAQKKEEILTLFLQDKLQKEERNTAVNLLKVNEGWRSSLRQTRAAELREDAAIFGQTFENKLDGLGSTMKNLERALQEVERQSAQVRRVHLPHLESLRAQQDKQLMFQQRQWENGFEHLSSSFASERTRMLAQSQQQRADLEDASFMLEQRHQEVMQETHALYNDCIVSQHSDQEDKTDTKVQEAKERLKEKKQEVLQLYSNEAEKLDKLVLRKQGCVQATDELTKKVQELKDLSLQLKVKISSAEATKEQVEEHVMAASNETNKKTHALQSQLTQNQTAARRRLTELTVQSNNATKKLQAVISKADKVLRVGEMCRKLESEQENVFTSASPAAPNQSSDTETEGAPEEKSEFAELQHVTRRINEALLHREALKEEKEHLSRENRQLRILLRQHLDAMTASDRTFDGRDALLTAYRAPTTTVPSDSDRRHTVIEAVHAVRQSL
ncbi:dynein regulatory complex subunit 2 [Toxotes jaculatrix]|uniref:dynein regulatory complex subunit 2 n=1 Tax=Toxotes jaculatrix TaxID=941984 RepID=UPI001B3A8833|nr:dynein regulatory complex subunit 2 [Toxotes jaculatrix]